jgi:hypothetical protein
MSIHLCQTCEHQEQGCFGGCRCLLDGRPVLEHTMYQRCPDGRFGTAAPLEEAWGLNWPALSSPATAPAPLSSPSPQASGPVAGGWLGHLAHGAAGLGKAALGIDRTEPFRLDYRRQCCSGCSQMIRKLGVETCALCGCVISAKTAVASERCPAGRW